VSCIIGSPVPLWQSSAMRDGRGPGREYDTITHAIEARDAVSLESKYSIKTAKLANNF
jgi:hypothetical protein